MAIIYGVISSVDQLYACWDNYNNIIIIYTIGSI